VGKSVLELRDVRQSATYTCNAQSDLGNIAADADVIVKGSYTAHIHSSSASTLYTFHHLATQIPSLLLLLLLLLLDPFNGLFSRTTWVSRYQKGKTSLDLNDTRDDGVLGCSGISWTICKQFAPRSRQITKPHQHVITQLFTGRMLFLSPRQRCQSTEGMKTTALAWHAIVLTT